MAELFKLLFYKHGKVILKIILKPLKKLLREEDKSAVVEPLEHTKVDQDPKSQSSLAITNIDLNLVDRKSVV